MRKHPFFTVFFYWAGRERVGEMHVEGGVGMFLDKCVT